MLSQVLILEQKSYLLIYFSCFMVSDWHPYIYIFMKIGIECGAKWLFLVVRSFDCVIVINLSEKAVMSAKSGNFRFGTHGHYIKVKMFMTTKTCLQNIKQVTQTLKHQISILLLKQAKVFCEPRFLFPRFEIPCFEKPCFKTGQYQNWPLFQITKTYP